ncbi:MAG: aryl-sulfate sulfotransferase, partial [Candidatus Thorarchaeota archaeon]
LRIITILFCFIIIVIPIVIFDTATTNSVPESVWETPSDLTPLVNDVELQKYEKDEISAIIDMNAVDYTVFNSQDSFEGYTLFTFYQRDRATSAYTNSLIVMDMNGTILAEKDLGIAGNFNCPAEFIDPDTILVGTQYGAQLWHIINDTMETLPIIGHHEYEYNPTTNTIFVFEQYARTIESTDYAFDYILEYTLGGSLVWSLDTYTFINESMWCPYEEMANLGADITHSNTIFYDIDENVIYYNSRNTNTFFKINRTTSEVIWGLGEYGNFTLYDIDGDVRNTLFYHAHAVEKVDDNTFILFDNDLHNQTYEYNRLSRILEISIDEDTMTANESWYYIAPPDYYSAGWGDADRLPNGNRIGCFGYPSTPSSGFSAAFVEVNDLGEVVWETKFMYDSDYIYGSYRLERFRYAPIITPLADFESSSFEPVLEWDVYYNFRNKGELPGDYILYVDDIAVDNGTFIYTQFWRPTTLSLVPGVLQGGLHNITLEISDGYNNYASDSVNVNVTYISLERNGLTTVEKGQQSLLPTWSGITLDEVSCNISLNGTLYSTFNWTGADIVLDPATIDLGTHLVELIMFNETMELYSDSFWLNVTPAESPIIIPQQLTTLSIDWGDSPILSWDIADVTGQTWSLYLDDSMVADDNWDLSSVRVNWTVPPLFDGSYNITLVATDLIGHVAVSETTLTVFPPTSPFILSSPGNLIIEWGCDDATFEWEIYGGTDWELDKNGLLLQSGNATGRTFEFTITEWREQDWRPGNHSLTLTLYLNELETTDTISVEVITDPGDPYVDAYISRRSESYYDGENAIGAPNGQFSRIYVDYENGYLTLDMGVDEEVIDESGFDFEVIASGDNYSVYIGNSLEESLEFLGRGYGNMSFDLSLSSLSIARYIRIQMYFGDSVNLDAIVALNYNAPSVDEDPPIISSVDDIEMWLGDVNTTLIWSPTDDTPWAYELLINSTINESRWWYGEPIEYLFEPESEGTWNITVIVYDAFGNSAVDSVLIEVKIPPNDDDDYTLVLLTGAGISAVVIIVLIYKKKLSS